jgi:hypothetical protein
MMPFELKFIVLIKMKHISIVKKALGMALKYVKVQQCHLSSS